ncbi:MarR family winged helix-turn-helix transcriptional regulator [Aquabacterium sp.]|uniref:MarR family winged helix-turn-helix transcriptional regulator n=1 Tax=Aquabacterium sp. TaxID=1872578 RepID=UPI002C1126A8|nr:MarR family transcriptional regulator [Aquabacterium sp.]HSW03075.1 MarR family transcriptional regulator [Aquabacterium sp.]
MTAPRQLSDILEGVAIPYAYKLGYMINSYREPSFRAIEATHGLTRPEILSLIFLCFRDGITASDICDFSGHLKNNISRAVTALEKKGLIRREVAEGDQRKQLIFITAQGRKMHDRFMPALVERETAMMACLSAEERRVLQRLLRKLCANVPAWRGTEHV